MAIGKESYEKEVNGNWKRKPMAIGQRSQWQLDKEADGNLTRKPMAIGKGRQWQFGKAYRESTFNSLRTTCHYENFIKFAFQCINTYIIYIIRWQFM